jgi:hypothetical protein
MSDRPRRLAGCLGAVIGFTLMPAMATCAAVLDAQDTARLVAVNEAIASFENDV